MITSILEFFSHAIFAFVVPGILIGLFSILASQFLPAVLLKYKVVLLISGILVVLFFVFQAGRLNVTNKYERQLLIEKVLVAEQQKKSAKIDAKIITEYIEKIKFVDRIKEINTNVYVTKKDDNLCIISLDTSDNIARLLNGASEGRLSLSSDRTDAKID